MSAFDEQVGLGEVDETWPFHCTQLADGSRSVDVGAEVDFEVRPSRGGYEAFDLRRAPTGGRHQG